MPNPLLLGGMLDLGSKLVDKLLTSPEEKAKAQPQQAEAKK